MSIDKQKTGFRPMISAILGRINDEIVHPMYILEPISPTYPFDLQARSS